MSRLFGKTCGVVLLGLCVASCSMFETLPQAVQFTMEEPGVRKCVPLDPELGTVPWMEQYDPETQEWYAVKRSPEGTWVRTQEAERLRLEILEKQREEAASTPRQHASS